MIRFFFKGIEYLTVITLTLIYVKYAPGGRELEQFLNNWVSEVASFDYSSFFKHIMSEFRK
jgi:hypothetical protein